MLTVKGQVPAQELLVQVQAQACFQPLGNHGCAQPAECLQPQGNHQHGGAGQCPFEVTAVRGKGDIGTLLDVGRGVRDQGFHTDRSIQVDTDRAVGGGQGNFHRCGIGVCHRNPIAGFR